MANPIADLFNRLFGPKPQPGGVRTTNGDLLESRESQQPQQGPVQQLVEENLTGPLGINAFLEQYAQSLGQAQQAQGPAPTLQAPVSQEQLAAEADPFQRSQLRAQNRGAFAQQAQAELAYELAPHVQALVESGGAYWEQMPPDVQETVARGVYALMGGPVTDLGVEISEDFVGQNLDDPAIWAALQAIASGSQDYFQALDGDAPPGMRSFTEIEGLPQWAGVVGDLGTGALGGFGDLAVGSYALSRVPGAVKGTRRALDYMDWQRQVNQTVRRAQAAMADQPIFSSLTPQQQQEALWIFLRGNPEGEFSRFTNGNGLPFEHHGLFHELANNVPALPPPPDMPDPRFNLFEGMDDGEADETFNRMADEGGELEAGGPVEFAGEADAMEELRARQAASGERILRDAQGLTPPEYADALVSGQADPGTALVSFAGALLDMTEEGILDPTLAGELGGAIELLANSGQVDTREILGLIRDGMHPDLADEVVRRATTRHNDLQWELANRLPPEPPVQSADFSGAFNPKNQASLEVEWEMLDDEEREVFNEIARHMADSGENWTGLGVLDGINEGDLDENHLREWLSIIKPEWTTEKIEEFVRDQFAFRDGPAPTGMGDVVDNVLNDPRIRERLNNMGSGAPRPARDELMGIIGEDGTIINLLTPDESGLIDPEVAINALVAKNQMSRPDAMSLVFRYLNETYNAGGPMDEGTMLGAAGLNPPSRPLDYTEPVPPQTPEEIYGEAAGNIRPMDDPFGEWLDELGFPREQATEGGEPLGPEAFDERLHYNYYRRRNLMRPGVKQAIEGGPDAFYEYLNTAPHPRDIENLDEALAERLVRERFPEWKGPIFNEDDMLRGAGLDRMGEGELSGINEADVEPGDLDELMIQARMWHERSGTEESFGDFLDRMAGDEVSFEDMLGEAGLSREEGIAGEVAGPAREPTPEWEEMPDPLEGKSLDLFEAMDAGDALSMESDLPDFERINGMMLRKGSSKGLDSNLMRGIASAISEMDDPEEVRELLGNYFTPMETDEIMGTPPAAVAEPDLLPEIAAPTTGMEQAETLATAFDPARQELAARGYPLEFRSAFYDAVLDSVLNGVNEGAEVTSDTVLDTLDSLLVAKGMPSLTPEDRRLISSLLDNGGRPVRDVVEDVWPTTGVEVILTEMDPRLSQKFQDLHRQVVRSHPGVTLHSMMDQMIRDTTRARQQLVRSGWSESDATAFMREVFRVLDEYGDGGGSPLGDAAQKAAEGVRRMPIREFDDPTVQWVDSSLLADASGNSLRRDAPEMEQLKRDILENGFQEPLVLRWSARDGSFNVGEGNHRLAIALELGIPVPVRVVTYKEHGGFGAMPPGPQRVQPDKFGYIPSFLSPEDVGFPIVDPLDPLDEYGGGGGPGPLGEAAEAATGTVRRWQVDNPATREPENPRAQEWLQENPDKITAYFEGDASPAELIDLPGARGEHETIDAEVVARAKERLAAEGFDPDQPIIVRVAQDGTATIWEGNHRLRAAQELGLESVPIYVFYEGGSEAMADSWKSEALRRHIDDSP